MAASAPRTEGGPRTADADGNDHSGSSDASGTLCLKNTFLHVERPSPRLRRQSSAPPSLNTSSSSRASMTDSSALFEKMDLLLKPGGAGPSKEPEAQEGSGSESEGELPSSARMAGGGSTSVADAQQQKRRSRTCKGKRDRIKKFISMAENMLKDDPTMRLSDLNPPLFIARDEVAMARLTERLAAFQASLLRGEQASLLRGEQPPAGHAEEPSARGAASSSGAALARRDPRTRTRMSL